MNKQLVFQALLEALESRLESTLVGFGDAAEYATSEEAKADSKYDTQGLEASYLAAGQAAAAKKIREEIERLQAAEQEYLAPRGVIARGALLSCRIERTTEWFYCSPIGGGETLVLDGMAIDVVSPATPLYRSFHGKAAGAVALLPSGSIGFIESVE